VSKERALTRAAVYLVLEQEGRVLLQLRKNSGFYDGYYGLPSGHWEYGEYLTDAMIREAKEETNIDLNRDDLDLRLVYHSSRNQTDNYVGIYFYTNKYSGDIRINEPDKCDDLRFFGYDELPENIIPYIAESLDAIKRGVNLIESEVISPEYEKRCH